MVRLQPCCLFAVASQRDAQSDCMDTILAVLKACSPCDQTKQALSKTHTHTHTESHYWAKVQQLHTDACKELDIHVQNYSGGYFRTFCTVDRVKLTPNPARERSGVLRLEFIFFPFFSQPLIRVRVVLSYSYQASRLNV